MPGKQEAVQQRFFNQHYSDFKEYKLENWRISFLKRIFEQLDIPGNNDLYLDIGVGGSGYTVVEAAKKGQRSVGIDLSFEGAKKARQFANQQSGGLASFVVCSAESLPFKNNVFAKVSSISVLEHVDNDRAAIKEIARVAAPQAKIFITVPNTYKRIWLFLWPVYFLADRWVGHMRHYSEENLVGYFTQAGLKVKEVLYSAHLIKLAQVLLEKLFRNNQAASRLWWRWEKMDLVKKECKRGLQLSVVFEKD